MKNLHKIPPSEQLQICSASEADQILAIQECLNNRIKVSRTHHQQSNDRQATRNFVEACSLCHGPVIDRNFGNGFVLNNLSECIACQLYYCVDCYIKVEKKFGQPLCFLCKKKMHCPEANKKFVHLNKKN